jgi:ABC-type lipoprotein release transport system permease subunit
MTRAQLVRRGLTYYWRTHLAVVAGVATAVAVLAGALLVGDSVRGSLRDLVLGRLGRTDLVVASTGFFREALAEAIAGDARFSSTFSGVTPLVMARGLVTDQTTGRRAGQVAVYGVDERFWRFHGVDVDGPRERDALVSPALASQLGSAAGSVVLVRVQRPTDVPIEWLHGRKDGIGQTLRLTVSGVVPAASLGEFSLEPQQGDVSAVFVPLSRLQQELEAEGRVNSLLLAVVNGRPGAEEVLPEIVRTQATLEDLGLEVLPPSSRGVLLTSSSGLLSDQQAAAAERARADGSKGFPILTYLANRMRVGGREMPYSLVTATDTPGVRFPASPDPDRGDVSRDPIVLNQWAADDLRARPGDALTMEYFVWEDPGRLVTRTAEFRVAGVVPIAEADRELVPSYPGISESPSLSDWDPPFPIDLRRVRPIDERYWERYRTTPKAYVPLAAAQRLWRSRYGAMTSYLVAGDDAAAFAGRLRASLDPVASGLGVREVRQASLAASRGATDFGTYFVYFSFFLVVSALLLAALFFKLGVEQRVREVGLLRAVGFEPADVRRLFLGEGLLLSIAGSVFGVLGALGYGALLMHALRTWWVAAVGTTSLTLHVTAGSLVTGAIGGIAAAVICIWWTLRSLVRISERSLLAGDISSGDAASVSGGRSPSTVRHEAGPHVSTVRHEAGPHVSRRAKVAPIALAVAGAALLLAGAAGWIDPAGAFFGAGFALLGAGLAACLVLFRRQARATLHGRTRQALARLGFRSAAYRPGRSVLSMSVIAAATFILISVDAFRRDASVADTDRRSGVGGYSLMVNTLLPVAHDPNTPEGRDALNLFDLDDSTRFEPFRLRPGDDASCLNLYEPRNPRILAPRDGFLEQGRFAFAESLSATPAERENPWLLLQRQEPDGAVPVIADANSMTYVLHRALGEEIVLPHSSGPIRLRLVAALRDSIFQGELLMSQSNFLRLFPELGGYQFFLVESAPGQALRVVEQIENGLSDLGVDAVVAADRLAEFHRVENTYLSTFQTLGGLGLLLGTVGLATVLLRNVLERRRELALLGAVGFRRAHVGAMIVAESALLLVGGLAIGAACAGLAIAPAIVERGGRLPLSTGGALLLFAVFATGLLSSVVALRAATRAPLLSSLRSE